MLLYRYEFVKDDYRIGFLTGLDDFFTDDEILAILKEDSTEEDRVEKIIAMANENGGRDNMGIVFITL